MAKKKKKKQTLVDTGVPAQLLYDLVEKHSGNVHPDYCFYHKEYEKKVAGKTVPVIEEAVCRKIDQKTFNCIAYTNPTAVIKPDNPILGCAFSPCEIKTEETVLKINPIKAAKRARKLGLK